MTAIRLQHLRPFRTQFSLLRVYSCTVTRLPRLFITALLPVLLPAILAAAVLPDTIGEWQKGPAKPAAVLDQKVWQEYGLRASETAEYAANGTKYSILAYRFTDATG